MATQAIKHVQVRRYHGVNMLFKLGGLIKSASTVQRQMQLVTGGIKGDNPYTQCHKGEQ